MTISAEALFNPGSFNDFREQSGLEGAEAIEGYSLSLEEYRRQLARRAGVSLEDLHDRKTQPLVEIADK